MIKGLEEIEQTTHWVSADVLGVKYTFPPPEKVIQRWPKIQWWELFSTESVAQQKHEGKHISGPHFCKVFEFNFIPDGFFFFFWLLHSHSSLCQITWWVLSPGSLISASDHTAQRTDAALLINAALQTKVKWHQRCWKALMRNHWINLGNQFLCNLCSSLEVFVPCAQLFNFLFLQERTSY